MNTNEQNQGMADVDFSAFKKSVKASFGLDLEAYKRPQMERRLRSNMGRYGAQTFGEYYKMMRRDPAIAEEFLDKVTINVSELFRNPEQFEVMQNTVLPELLHGRSGLRTWSAGCSCGAEAYTLAILLEEAAPSAKHEILATDIDDRMLARAASGIYQPHETKNISKPRMSKYFDELPDGHQAKSSLKRMIKFGKHDLLRDKFETSFDLILCRNVVIYFTDETKSTLYSRFFDALRPGGYLFVGGTERISGSEAIGFENRIPFFYRKPLQH